MIVIRDQQLRLLVLAQLVRDLQRSAGAGAAPPGFTPEQVELSALDREVKLSEMTEPRVAVEIDAGSLERPGSRSITSTSDRGSSNISSGTARPRTCSPSSSDFLGGRDAPAPALRGDELAPAAPGDAAAPGPGS